MAIGPETHKQLRSILLSCWQSEGGRSLSSLFADPRLQPWQYALPEAASIAGRVDALISLLQKRQSTEDDRNALVLFLEVLADHIDPGDACHGQLHDVARRVETELAREPQPDVSRFRALGELNRVHLLELLNDRFSGEDLRDLSFRLNGLDFDALPGYGKSAKARELIRFLQRRGRLEELVEAGRELRPDIPWDEAYR